MRMNINEVRASKSLGQNFIKDTDLMEGLVRSLDIQENDSVLEVGAGLGTLTEILANYARDVHAIEIDTRFKETLDNLARKRHNIRLTYGDAVRLDWRAAADGATMFVSNLPYYISTPLITKTIYHLPRFRTIAVMVQLEVAEKIIAEPDTEQYGTLAAKVAALFRAEIARVVPSSAFTPEPHVDSAFVVMKPQALIEDDECAKYDKLIRASFAARRKTMLSNIKAGYSLTREAAEALLVESRVEPSRRAETLSAQEFVGLLRGLSQYNL